MHRLFLPSRLFEQTSGVDGRASHARGRLRWRLGITLVPLSWMALTGCAPELDWRSFQPDGLPLAVAFPCRPDRAVRTVALAGQRLEMTLLSCLAGERQYALLSTRVGDVGQVPGVLQALAAAAQTNLQAQVLAEGPAAVGGMTPLPQARQLSLAGPVAQGRAVHQQLVVFSYGPQVFQATVLGPAMEASAVQPFFDALRIRAAPP